MAVYTEEIYAAAQDLGGPESPGLKKLCAAAEDSLRGRLKEGAEGYEETMKQSAAMLALSNFYAAGAAEPGVSYSAGTVSVSVRRAEGTKAVQALETRAEAMMAPFLKDSGFDFMEVMG